MKQPKGTDLLKCLVKLYAEQEGVKIKCEITDGKDKNEKEN